ncbi:poly-gamma-glutamate hydrolase family protein [Dasania marina]|uniref:poly-gamma-glutamate hydrolase family protein n=1 Tax=Dasania marina TaxID=471499 RepID=UPI000363ED5F|nr:poly-gamma-glutamate hydrolase family protein [Dasania marina]
MLLSLSGLLKKFNPLRNIMAKKGGVGLRSLRRDKYANYGELSAQQREGIDFQVRQANLYSKVAIIAPHAGRIEPGTSGITRAIAGEELSYYLFEGRRWCKNFSHLHITSTNFDEPKAVAMAESSQAVVTVHGCVIPNRRIYVGGYNEALKETITEALTALGYRCDFHPKLSGYGDSNICNRGESGGGVQLEFTALLRMQLFINKMLGGKQLFNLAAAIRYACLDVTEQAESY